MQNLGYRGRDLLKWAGAEVQLVDRCCGMDGTWGMKTEFFAESLKVAEAAANRVDSAEPDVEARWLARHCRSWCAGSCGAPAPGG